MTKGDGRDKQGRFAPGNPGGPGRPRRPVEREYLAALSDAVPVEDWDEICKRAVQDAKDGDGKAREWVAHYVMGKNPMTLFTMAVHELIGATADGELAAKVQDEISPSLDRILTEMSGGGETFLARAARLSTENLG